MKKLWISLLITLMCLSMSACGKIDLASIVEDVKEKIEAVKEPQETQKEEVSEASDTDSEEDTEEDSSEVLMAEIEEVKLFEGEEPLEFTFTSGAGGWSTYLTLYADGTFEGSFHDSNMGEIGELYPNGTVYVCNFNGKFGNISSVNGYTYSMDLVEMNLEYDEGEEWIEDGMLYIASEPYGLDGGTEFLFYLPETPRAGLSEEFLSWDMYYFASEAPKMLEHYAVHNVAMDYGFFSY